jgi:hypothetical protein
LAVCTIAKQSQENKSFPTGTGLRSPRKAFLRQKSPASCGHGEANPRGRLVCNPQRRLVRDAARPGPQAALSSPHAVLDEEKIGAFFLYKTFSFDTTMAVLPIVAELRNLNLKTKTFKDINAFKIAYGIPAAGR